MMQLPREDLEHILARTAGLWEGLRGARLFITGGTGFFGKWLLASLAVAHDQLGLDARAVVLSRDVDGFRDRFPDLAGHPALEFCSGDLCTFAFPAGSFSHVIHAATPSDARLQREQPLAMSELLIEGTRRVLEFARQAGARRFLFTSSGAVYGRQPPELSHVPEAYPGAPDPLDRGATYAEGKRFAEHLCALYYHCHGLETTVARCFAFVGPYLPLDAHFAIGNFIRDGLQGGPIRVQGDGTPYRSYLHAADLMIWLWTILLRGQPCRAYNVGSEQAVTIAELARIVGAQCSAAVEIAQQPRPGATAARYVPSTWRACEEMGLATCIGLEEAIARTVRWHRAGHMEEGNH